MENSTAITEKNLEILELHNFNIGVTYRKEADRLVKKYGTGKSRRLLQLWATDYEILIDGLYYIVKIYDQPQGRDQIQEGSDFE